MNQLPTVEEQMRAVNEFFGELRQQDTRLRYEEETDEPEALAA